MTTLHTLESLPPLSILAYVLPFYAYLRLLAHLYLLLPLPDGSNGAEFLYHAYISPFFIQHEREIEEAVTRVHEAARRVPGWQYAEQALLYARDRVARWSGGRAQQRGSQADRLASQFLGAFGLSTGATAPQKRQARPEASGVAAAGQLYGAASAALGMLASSAASTSKTAKDKAGTAAQSASRNLADFPNDKERLSYVQSERDRLRSLLEAYAKEERRLNESVGLAYGAGGPGSAPATGQGQGMARSRSEAEFEVLRQEDVGVDAPVDDVGAAGEGSVGRIGGEAESASGSPETRKSGGWGSWMWGAGGQDKAAAKERKDR